jgi:hypothetical protein
MLMKIKNYNSFIIESGDKNWKSFDTRLLSDETKDVLIGLWLGTIGIHEDKYHINPDRTVDIYGHIDLKNKGLTKLPIRFGEVTGYFNCSNNQLTTLEGSPRKVGGFFGCDRNQLTTLEGGPTEVLGTFNCGNNKLTSLVGGPEVVLRDYYANNNQITSFEGFPEDIDGDFTFFANPVQKVLDQFPEELWTKSIHLINDYDAIWNGEVVPERLEMVKEKLGLI